MAYGERDLKLEAPEADDFVVVFTTKDLGETRLSLSRERQHRTDRDQATLFIEGIANTRFRCYEIYLWAPYHLL